MRMLFYKRRIERDVPAVESVDSTASKALQSDGHRVDAGACRPTSSCDCRDGEILAAAIAHMSANAERIMMKVFDPAAGERGGREPHPPLGRSSPIRRRRSSTRRSTVAYPSSDGQKTDAQLTILVPRAQLKTTTAGDVDRLHDRRRRRSAARRARCGRTTATASISPATCRTRSCRSSSTACCARRRTSRA